MKWEKVLERPWHFGNQKNLEFRVHYLVSSWEVQTASYEEAGGFHNTYMKIARVDENVASLFFYAFQFEALSPQNINGMERITSSQATNQVIIYFNSSWRR